MPSGSRAPAWPQTHYTKGSGPGGDHDRPSRQPEYLRWNVHLTDLLEFGLGILSLAQFLVQHDDGYQQHQFD